MCLSPVYLRESKTFVPCGKCGECLKERGSEWRFRLMYQCKLSKLALWCTFTYADANSLSKDHAQTLLRSFDDVFKPVRRIGGKRIRVHSIIMKYYLIGEYGTHTYRPHYHAILFFDRGEDYKEDVDIGINCISLIPLVASKWPYGMVNITQCNSRVVNYICDTHLYLMNDNLSVDPRLKYGLNSNNEPTFRLFSKGLGRLPDGSIPMEDYNYIKSHRHYRFGEMKISVPKDWKDRYFNIKEKEQMRVYSFKQIAKWTSYDDPYYRQLQDSSMKNSIRSRITKKTQL